MSKFPWKEPKLCETRVSLQSPKCLGTRTSVEKNIFFGKFYSSRRTSAFINPLVQDKRVLLSDGRTSGSFFCPAQDLKKSCLLVWHRTSRISSWASNFLPSLVARARTQASCPPTKFLIMILKQVLNFLVHGKCLDGSWQKLRAGIIALFYWLSVTSSVQKCFTVKNKLDIIASLTSIEAVHEKKIILLYISIAKRNPFHKT